MVTQDRAVALVREFADKGKMVDSCQDRAVALVREFADKGKMVDSCQRHCTICNT
jgi:hypothetical protein